MKLIFLDLDGVLVTDRHFIRSNEYQGYEFDPFCVQMLKEIIEETGCKIVISSSWRESRTLEEMQNIFSYYGIYDRIIGFTPVLDIMSNRGEEIQSYLSDLNLFNTKYVVIDDEEEMGMLESKTVRTNSFDGITKEDKKEIISKLL